MPWFGQAVDAADGRFFLGRPWWKPFGRKTLRLDWRHARSEAVVQALVELHKRLSADNGGISVEPPSRPWFLALLHPHPHGARPMVGPPTHALVRRQHAQGRRNKRTC